MWQSKNPYWNRKDAYNWLVDCAQCFKKIHWFLKYGTLLGAVRESDFIEWDFDIDMGALPKDLKHEDEIIKCLESRGFKAFVCVIPKDEPKARFIQISRGGITGHLSWNHFNREMNRKYFNKLDTAFIQKMPVPIPINADGYLTYLYDEWKTPRGPSDPKSRPRGHKKIKEFVHPSTGPKGSWHG